ncbi:MAG: hypothetical protein SGJ13_12600 [Actinomycetota bacterium]|nr:hypothetical protein [Actinomycetota bacterium]
MEPTTTEPRPAPSPPLQRLAVVIAAAGLVFATIALAAVVTDDDPAGPEVLSADEAAASGNPTIELYEMFITGDLSVESGATVTVVNAGAILHNLEVEGGPRTPDLNSDEAANLDLSQLAPGTYTAFCAIEGHRASGMEDQLVVGATQE